MAGAHGRAARPHRRAGASLSGSQRGGNAARACASGRHLGGGPGYRRGASSRRGTAAARHQRRHGILKGARSMMASNFATVLGHPLLQHKLTLLRQKQTSTAEFRRLAREMSLLMCYEVTRDLPLEMISI